MDAKQSFTRRLQLGLGALVATTLLGLVAVLGAERGVGRALGSSAAALGRLEDFQRVRIELADAREAEREFLLEDLRAPNFFRTGTSEALTRHARAVASLERRLERLASDPATAPARVAHIREAVGQYRNAFAQLVSLYRERGNLYSGHLGELRRATFEMQRQLEHLPPKARGEFRSELLELVRDESQYLRDLDNRPRFLVSERLQVLEEELATFPRSASAGLRHELESFRKAWERLVAIDERIGRSTGSALRGELLRAQEAVKPLTEAAVDDARASFTAARARVEHAAAMARWVSVGATLLALGIGLTVALSLGRHLRRSLAAVLAAVEAYRRGDRGARVGQLPRPDEFAILGDAFDRLAETLAETTEELEEINASLELAVKGDTEGLVERIKALVAQRKVPAS